MEEACPKLIALNRDKHYAKWVGRPPDGRPFFLTNPFVPGRREFLALYLFDPAGQLLEARIEDLGPRRKLDRKAMGELRDTWLASLGDWTPGRIEVAPFYVERFDEEFGFIPNPPEGRVGWQVTVEPGNYMAFTAPWTSGIYDT
jgi:hypothetical protein